MSRPYVGLVESYYGRLLTREVGAPYGTFIHFDLEPRSIDATGGRRSSSK